MGPWKRLWIILVLTISSWSVSSGIVTFLAYAVGQARLAEYLFAFLGLIVQLAWPLWIADLVVEKLVTRRDIQKLTTSPAVVLATRGEYIGGHPKLPHGRFVYLTVSGRLESPHLTIMLPGGEGRSANAFTMPVLDVGKTTEKKEKDGDETTLSVGVSFLTFRFKLLGERAVLNVEYFGQAGRKRRVELTNFLSGNGEVQTWRNYIVCIQGEADTGETPYGPWKSLPRRSQAI